MKVTDIFEDDRFNDSIEFQASLEDPSTGKWIYPVMNAQITTSKGQLEDFGQITSMEDFTYNGRQYAKGQEIQIEDFHGNEANADWAYEGINYALQQGFSDRNDNFNEPDEKDNGGFPPAGYDPFGEPRG